MGMRYRLRTLMILLVVAPPAIAWISFNPLAAVAIFAFQLVAFMFIYVASWLFRTGQLSHFPFHDSRRAGFDRHCGRIVCCWKYDLAGGQRRGTCRDFLPVHFWRSLLCARRVRQAA
jgi:hypothetical protein